MTFNTRIANIKTHKHTFAIDIGRIDSFRVYWITDMIITLGYGEK